MNRIVQYTAAFTLLLHKYVLQVLQSHVNKKGILVIQDSRFLEVLLGTFLKIMVFHNDCTQMLYLGLPATVSAWQTAFQILKLSLLTKFALLLRVKCLPGRFSDDIFTC